MAENRLGAIQKRLNVRRYKKKAYTAEQIDKAQRKYTSVQKLVDIQLTGEDSQLALSFSVNPERLAHAKERDGRYMLATNRPLSEEEMLSKRASISMTGERILKQFQTSTVVYTIFKDESCWKQVAPLTKFQSEFIQALDLPDPGIYLKRIKLE